ncbi:hypothetical protein C1708_06815 [Streptomyces sp. DH-12]|nr:hypothetical protein C1708_06815 [Streptomyces sp. DH-12]
MCPSDRHVSHARTGPGAVPMREPPKGAGQGKPSVAGRGPARFRPARPMTAPSEGPRGTGRRPPS